MREQLGKLTTSDNINILTKNTLSDNAYNDTVSTVIQNQEVAAIEEEAAQKLESLVVEVVPPLPQTSDPEVVPEAVAIEEAEEAITPNTNDEPDPETIPGTLEPAPEPDAETFPGITEPAPPSLPVPEQTPDDSLLPAKDVCTLLGVKDYKLSKMSDDEIRAEGFERVKVGQKSKYRKLL